MYVDDGYAVDAHSSKLAERGRGIGRVGYKKFSIKLKPAEFFLGNNINVLS